MLDEFTQIRRKTNVLALAVAVIIGTAIGKVVSSVVTTSDARHRPRGRGWGVAGLAEGSLAQRRSQHGGW